MSTESSLQLIYASAGIKFEEIITGGKLGGPDGLERYLETRQKQLARRLDSVDLADDERDSLLLAISAMREGVDLVGLLRLLPA